MDARGTGGNAHGDREDERGNCCSEHAEDSDGGPQTKADAALQVTCRLLLLSNAVEEPLHTSAVGEEGEVHLEPCGFVGHGSFTLGRAYAARWQRGMHAAVSKKRRTSSHSSSQRAFDSSLAAEKYLKWQQLICVIFFC